MARCGGHTAGGNAQKGKGLSMANRVFQGVIYQMKDAIDRMVGVVDEAGTIISCTDLNRIGEVRDGVASERLAAGDSFVRDGFTYHLFTANKRNDYAVLVEGTDEAAGRYAALLAISLQNIKQYHDEKFDKANFIKNVVLPCTMAVLPFTCTSPNRHASHSMPLAASTSATNPPYNGNKVRPVALNSCFSNFPNI